MLPLPHLREASRPAARSCTTGTLPAYVDPAQPPTKKQPFAALRAQKWISSLEVMLPREIAGIVRQDLASRFLRYAKVMLKLHDLLDGDLFTEGIKRGNIMVLSEGRSGVDNRFELYDGLLRLELDKATYERAGLQGTPMRDGGLKHKDNRYAIEINLRHPSMLHGKKGFERIIWACRNVLDHSLTCLFHDRTAGGTLAASEALEKHHPRWFTSQAREEVYDNVAIPNLVSRSTDETLDADASASIEEWLALVALDSPRVRADDNPNSFICRYSPPEHGAGDRGPVSGSLSVLRWHGFLPCSFGLEVLLALKKTTAPNDAWWAIRSMGMGREHDAVTLMQRPGQTSGLKGFVCWHSPG